MSDYFCDDINSDNYLRIYSAKIPRPINFFQQFKDDPIEYLNICKEFADYFDITYSPLLNKKLLGDDVTYFHFGKDEAEQALIKFSSNGDSFSSSQLKDLCSQDIPDELKNSYTLMIGLLNNCELPENKTQPLEFKKDCIIFKPRYLEKPKVLKILLENKIIDADDYDGGSCIIFELINENKIEVAKLLIEHSKTLVLKEFEGKNLLEYCQEKLPENTALHELILKRFDKIKNESPRASLSQSSAISSSSQVSARE